MSELGLTDIGSAEPVDRVAKRRGRFALYRVRINRQRLLLAAMGLFTVGWSLVWARSLNLVGFVPFGCPILLLLSGLALVPFSIQK